MNITNIKLENYTVFENVSISFCKGINVFIGENATGKTHLLKLLYAACRSNRTDIDFGYKIVRTMMPDDFRISRLLTRRAGNSKARIKVCACSAEEKKENQLMLSFDRKTKKVGGRHKGENGMGKGASRSV